MKRFLLFLFCFQLLLQAKLYAQDSIKKIEEIKMEDEFTLEDLMNVKLTVASQKELTSWQTPSILTVFTREDISKMPGSDLVDIIRLIPGFEFGADIQGAIGVGVRGAWASEGKVLVLLDGLQMNENMYGTTQWLGHFDINQIERIEVVRGPGYAYYNGMASLGVINIVTRKGEQINGLELGGTYGRLNNSFGHQMLSLQGGFKHKDLDVVLAGFGGQLNRFAGSYADYTGTTIELNKDKNALGTPLQFRLSADFKGLSVKYLHDDFKTQTRLFYGDLVDKSTSVDYYTRQVEISYKWKINEKLSLKPLFNVNYNRPWITSEIADTIDSKFLYYDRRTIRYTSVVHANYQVNDMFQVNAGIGEYHDDAWATNPSLIESAAYAKKPSYTTFYEYAELFFQRKTTTASLGVRNENHNVAGSVILPRLALTQQWRRFNFKASLGRSFRSPLVENLYVNPQIKPELTTVSEIEIAYKVNDNLLLSTNLFSNEIHNIIVYGTVGTQDIYYNEKELDTKGVEAEMVYRIKNFNITANYSFYRNFHQYFSAYATPKEDALLGFANHKVALHGSYSFNKVVALSATGEFLSEKYAVNGIDGMGEYTMALLPASYLVNSTLSFQNIPHLKGLNISLGCYNIFNTRYVYVQAYKGLVPPYVGLGREFVVKVNYTFSKN